MKYDCPVGSVTEERTLTECLFSSKIIKIITRDHIDLTRQSLPDVERHKAFAHSCLCRLFISMKNIIFKHFQCVVWYMIVGLMTQERNVTECPFLLKRRKYHFDATKQSFLDLERHKAFLHSWTIYDLPTNGTNHTDLCIDIDVGHTYGTFLTTICRMNVTLN